MRSSACRQPSSSLFFPLKRIASGLFLSTCLLSGARATQLATTTHLTIAAPTVAVGVPTLLTATVTDAASHPVLLGTVTFYDGKRTLGSAQIVNKAGGSFTQGTANVKTASFLPGANSITAVFAATVADAASTSAAKTVTVTGQNLTTTALSAITSGGNYTLTATLQSFGSGIPTGSIDFLDTTAGASLGAVPLSTTVWGPDFSVGTVPDVSPDPLNVITADFNGDGSQDVAIVDAVGEQNYIRILLGNGDGTFRTPVSYSLGLLTPFSIVAGDFNNDGHLDLAVPDFSSSTLDVFLGVGDGTFLYEPPIQTAQSGYALAIGDFNRDGNLDLAELSYNPAQVNILLGDGTGNFQAQPQTYSASGNWTLLVGDLNGDGIEDLLVSGVTVLLGKGNGTFNPPQTSTTTSSYEFATLADINGDGKLDLIESNPALNFATVSLGNGNGTFQAAQTYNFNTSPGQPFLEDINQDSKLDVVLPSYGSFAVLLGNGLGGFQPEVLPNLARSAPYASAQGDLNGDGLLDIVNPGADFLLGEAATVTLPNIPPPVSETDLIHASYPGDALFKPSSSNAITITPLPTIDFSGGFADSQPTLQMNGATLLDDAALRVADGSPNTAGSAFTKAPVNVQAFTTDFTFQITDPVADGFTFTIQNQGPTALGSIGGGLGYRHIAPSVAIKFDLYNNLGEGPNSTGLYTGGEMPAYPAVNLTGTGIDLHSQHAIQAHITYDGANLTMTLTDAIALVTWSHVWTIDIPTTVGGPTAYVGFTGATGSSASNDSILSWTYFARPPAPNYPTGFQSTNLALNGSALLGSREVELTNGTPQEAGSAFYANPQNVQAFTTDFTFLLLNPAADGFTFTLQNEGPAALGSHGGGLGYSGIPKSVAIKFDLYSNLGEGPDSTGIYTAGALPALPALDLTGSGIDLHNEDPFEAHLTYDGTTLTLTLRDTLTLGMYTHSWAIDIPTAVGGNTAYVGFTAGTGGEFANQMILTWTFHPGAS